VEGGEVGKLPHRRLFFAAIFDPLAISGRALATFPEYELTTRWRFQTVFVAFQKSNMASGKPDALKSAFCSFASSTTTNEISTDTPTFRLLPTQS
jgi:hypothetical protein